MSAVLITALSVMLTGIMIVTAGDIFSRPHDRVIQPRDNTTVIDLYTASDSSAEMEARHRDFAWQSILYLVGVTALGIAAAWFIVRRGLRPISKLSQLIEDIDVNNLSQPLPVPASNDEVARLTISFNNMLAKLNSSFEGQKRFVQNAAHELKTPITAILTNIEVMELDEEPSLEDYKQVIKVTKDNAQRMSLLVQDLLLVNVESKEANVQFSFAQLLEEILADLAQEIQAKGIAITRQGDVLLRGNRALLRRAFLNIIHNAVRYNRQGGRIRIECIPGKIAISDTGIGIPAAELEKIFEPFYCVDPSRSRQLGGSGLGLAMVKQIFDQHNLKLSVASQENQGTTFAIILES